MKSLTTAEGPTVTESCTRLAAIQMHTMRWVRGQTAGEEPRVKSPPCLPSSMKKMKRAAQLSDDTDQLPRQQQRVRIGTVHGGGGRWARTSCTTTSWFGLTEPMFGIADG